MSTNRSNLEKDFKNFVNNTRDEFEEQMKTSAIFYKKLFLKLR